MRVATFRDRKIRKEEKQRAEIEMALKGNLLSYRAILKATIRY